MGTRRGLLRASAKATLALGGACAISRSGVSLRASRIADAQDGETLTIALLDWHAARLEDLLDAYAEEAGIDIEVVSLDYEELYLQVSLALTQQAPTFDVVSLEDAWIPQFASLLTPVDDTLFSNEQIIQVAYELTRYPSEANPCGVPWLGDAQFFAARSQWLESNGFSLPETWDGVNATANKLDVESEDGTLRSAFAISSLGAHQLVDSFLPILRGYGNDLIDPETSVPQLDTPQALEAIETFLGLSALSPEESGATGAPTNPEKFQSGEVAMMSNFWSSDLLALAEVEQLPNSGPVESAWQPAQGNVPRQAMSGVWIAGVPIGSGKLEIAQQMASWLVSEPVQRQLVELNLPPVVASAYTDDALIDTRPDLPQLLDFLANSTPRPRSPYYPQLEQLLAIELQTMLKGEQTGEEAMRNANIAMREFLAREGILSV